jgi:hypothetical protein
MKKHHWWLGAGILLLLVLVLTNPTEADFRERVRERQGLAGTLGLAAADLLSGGQRGGIKRDNYGVASRFYLGGDGVLPRRNLGWGMAGMIWEAR